MNAKFVSVIGNPMVADFTRFKKHFKYLTLTPDEEASLAEKAARWELYCTIDTDVSHDEYGDYSLDTKYDTTRLTDFHGEIIVKDGRIVGVINSYGIIKPNQKLVCQSESWESRAVYYYTRTFTLRPVAANK